MSTGAYPGPRPDRASAQRKRDAALARLTRVRAVTLIAAGTLTAAVAGLVSAASGRTLGAKHQVRSATPVARATPRASTHATMPALASPGQLGLGGPASAPQAAPQPQPTPSAQGAPQSSVPAPAVSGGS